MVSIRFYTVDESDLMSKAVYYIGRLRHDASLSHVAVEWDGGIYELTIQGVSYCTLEDEENYRPPAVVMYLNEEYENQKNDMYPRSIALAYANMRVHIRSLLKLWAKLPLGDKDILCTDFIQIMLGDEPIHLTPIELLLAYFPYAESIAVSDENIWDNLRDTLLALNAEAEIT